MKNHPLVISAFLCAFVIFYPAFSQPSLMGTMSGSDTIRIMDYNILNYPGSTSSARNPYFRTVVHSAKPDVIVTLENLSQSGVTEFLNSVLNYYQAGLYSTITFTDGPDTDPHIFYKSSKVTFLSASYFLMADGLRNIGRYQIKVNSSGDTLFLYAIHLKASSGSSNEAIRLTEATALRDTLNKLPAGTKFMVMGDYNFYSSTESAFIKFTESQTDNDGRLKDPINQVGSWHDNATYALYHTQSPRIADYGDGGATGGMDDRFDFILTSYLSLDSNTIVSSYRAYGNDGNHMNDSLSNLPNTAVPDSVAFAVTHASDHIPVICDFKFGTSSIGSFSLSSPSSGATNQSIAGSLSWSTSSGATGYDVYLGTVNPPTAKVSSNQAGTSYSYSGLSYSTTYYWKVVAKNSIDSTTATGSPRSFTTIVAPPAAFSMTSPSNAAINQPISGVLSWATSTNATGYDVYLGTTNPPTSKVSANQSGTTYNYSGISNNTVYYWKIVGRNVNDTIVATGAPWSFTTIQASPAAFTLLSPSNGATNQTISGTLNWNASTNATGYDVYLGTVNPPTTKVSSNQAGASYNYNGLSYASTYYWKVVAKNAVDSVTATGSPWSFSTNVAPPVAFSMTSPANGATGQSVSGTLTWLASVGATSYDVYIGVTTPPTTKVNVGTATSYNYSGLSYNTIYYWKVVAKNSADSIAATGSPWSFTTIMASPSAFSMTSPANGATDQPVSGTLTWATSANATGYDVYLGSTNPPTTKISSNQVDTTYSYTDLSHSEVYYWNVVAKNDVDSVVAAGASWSFTTAVDPPGGFTLLSPVNSSTGQPLTGTLRWTTSLHASVYDVYLGMSNPPSTKLDSNLTDTIYYYSNLTPDSTYYWSVVAKNISGNISASGAPWNFTIVSLPHAPSSVLIANRSVSSLEIHWIDNATNESGYRVYRSDNEAGPFMQVDGDLPSNATAFKDSVLGVNQRYYYHIVPFNEFGEGQFATIIVVTLAEVPGEPLLTDVLSRTLTIAITPNANPASTQFAIAIIHATTTEYIQADGTVGTDPTWRTYSQWGGVNGQSVTGLNACQTYTIGVRARNLDSLETSDGSAVIASMLCNETSLSVSEGWNLISVPVQVDDNRKSTLFPTAQSSAFTYHGNYTVAESLELGSGYWLKFNAGEEITLFGDYCTTDTISLVAGWNIIGSISTPIDTRTISTDPPDIIISNFYSYTNGYVISDTIYPAKGYWVKSNSTGKLILSSAPILGKKQPMP
jgi:hypothetical protein